MLVLLANVGLANVLDNLVSKASAPQIVIPNSGTLHLSVDSYLQSQKVQFSYDDKSKHLHFKYNIKLLDISLKAIEFDITLERLLKKINQTHCKELTFAKLLQEGAAKNNVTSKIDAQDILGRIANDYYVPAPVIFFWMTHYEGVVNGKQVFSVGSQWLDRFGAQKNIKKLLLGDGIQFTFNEGKLQRIGVGIREYTLQKWESELNQISCQQRVIIESEGKSVSDLLQQIFLA